MKNYKKLSPQKVRCANNFKDLTFKTTKDLLPWEGIIGQDRAIKAMEFGLRMKHHGYNIFISGITGTGKTSYARQAIAKLAKSEQLPDDWLYVFNFENPEKPFALNLPSGWGSRFSTDMQELMTDLREAIPKAFSSEDYERQKASYIKEFQEKRSFLMEELNQKAEKEGFVLKKTSGGYITVPVINGKEIGEEEYNTLDPQEREELEKRSTDIQLKAMDIMRRIQLAEKEVKGKVRDLDRKIGLLGTGHLFDAIREKYAGHPKVIRYLELLQEDILDNLEDFRGHDEEEQTPFPWLRRQNREQFGTRYQVNLFVDNRETKGAPVIFEPNPTYYNLIGRMEYESRFGMVSTDFTMITAGSLHRANGGYLILPAYDLLYNLQAWDVLKRVLKIKEIRMENIGENLGLISVASLKPEPIPLKVKVILIGSPLYYHLLYHYDEDFRKLFKIKVDFSSEMERSSDNMRRMAAFISSVCHRENLLHFDQAAVGEVIDYSSRLAAHQEKLGTCFNELMEIIYEAEAWAGLEQNEYVTKKHVQRAIKEKNYRSDRYEREIQENIVRGQVFIDVEGKVVGQVNGLAVIDLGDYRFGRPFRITASAFVGRRGIINIERESNMSGRIHDKGVLILTGYLGYKYAREIPLTLSASICFEQQYHGIEGDSASSAELYALLSSLSGLPLKQGLAVTGSVNQKGEVQPVGGLTEKIEGFYKVCQIKKFTGKQGVLIPESNVQNLTLSQEIVEAVAKGLFHIYPVKTIDEGISILTEVSSATVDARVFEALKRYHTLTSEDEENLTVQ